MRTGVLLLLALGQLSVASAQDSHADRVLVNGRILTVDATDSVAEAIAIKDGIIVAVGDNAAIEAHIGPQTDRIDLEGNTATPGLLDTHVHFSSGGLLELTQIDLSYPFVKSVDDVRRLARDRMASLGEEDWLLGRGWDEGKLDERRYILAADLDPITGDRPAWLLHTMGHYGTANSAALKRAGIDRDTPDPTGGVIDRDEAGNPTGVLKETAMSLVTRHVPPTRPGQMREAIRLMSRKFNSEGMTGGKDPGIGSSLGYDAEYSMDTWNAYQEVLDEGDLTVRMVALWRSGNTLADARALVEAIAPLGKPSDPDASDRLISGGIKLFADGSGGARTAWVWEDWNKELDGVDAGNPGYPAIDEILLRDLIMLYHDAGLHVGIHAIGDRAIDWTVASLAMAEIRNPQQGLRHSIIHANIPSDYAMDTMAWLQESFDAGYPEPQAAFTWWIGDTYAGNFGAERSRRLNPFRDFLDRGIQWAGGSDFSVTPFPARYGISASMAREPLLGVYGKDVFGDEQAVDARTALRSFTIWAAHQLFLEDKIGSLEVGKYADIAVWDTDIYNAAPAAVKEMKCLMTLLEGEIVYEAE